MESPIKRFLAMHGIPYKIYRNDNLICEVEGLAQNDGVNFQIGTDVETGDVLVNPSNERFYVSDKKTVYANKNAMHITVYTVSEAKHNVAEISNNPVFNIGNVSNSIIGTQNNATIYNGTTIEDLRDLINQHNSADKEQLENMVDLLEKELSSDKPIKKGFLSKFAVFLQNNEWIMSPLAAFILEYIGLHFFQ